MCREADMPDGTAPGQEHRAQNGYMGPARRRACRITTRSKFTRSTAKLDMPAASGRDELEKAMSGHILASGVYNGLFHR